MQPCRWHRVRFVLLTFAEHYGDVAFCAFSFFTFFLWICVFPMHVCFGVCSFSAWSCHCVFFNAFLLSVCVCVCVCVCVRVCGFSWFFVHCVFLFACLCVCVALMRNLGSILRFAIQQFVCLFLSGSVFGEVCHVGLYFVLFLVFNSLCMFVIQFFVFPIRGYTSFVFRQL